MHQPGPSAVPPGPLDLGGILGGTFRILRRRLGLFAVLSVAPGFVLAIVIAGASVPIVLAAVDAAQGNPSPDVAGIVGAGTLVFLALTAAVLAQVKCEGMMCLAAHDIAHGGSPDLRNTWSRTHGLVPRVLLFYLATTVAGTILVAGIGALAYLELEIAGDNSTAITGVLVPTFLVLLTLWLGVILLTVRLLYFLPVLAIEGAPAMVALARSWRLTRGNFWRTLGYYLLASAIGSTVTITLSSLSQLVMMPVMVAGAAAAGEDPSSSVAALAVLPAMVVTSLIQIVVTLLVIPFVMTYVTVMYVDQVRRAELSYRATPYRQPPAPMR